MSRILTYNWNPVIFPVCRFDYNKGPFKQSWYLMIVGDSFNYHWLSLTIMFAIKRSIIVNDTLWKSRNASFANWYLVSYRVRGGALNFAVTKMAVCQPRIAAIATILVTVIQDDICEELLGRHKRGIKLPLHSSLPFFQISSLFSLSRFQRHCRPNICPNYGFVVLHRTMAMP